MSDTAIISILCGLLVAESIFLYNMLRHAKKLVQAAYDQYEIYRNMHKLLMEHYDTCTAHVDAIDSYCELIEGQYKIIKEYLIKQEENKNGMAV